MHAESHTGSDSRHDALRAKRVVRPATAAKLLDVSLSTFWRRVANDPTFPRPFRLGGPHSRTTVIDAQELSEWIMGHKNSAAQ